MNLADPFTVAIFVDHRGEPSRAAHRPRDDRGLDPLSLARRPRHGHRRRAAAQRHVHQLAPARGAALHPLGRDHELGHDDRAAAAASAMPWSAASAAASRRSTSSSRSSLPACPARPSPTPRARGKMMQKMMTEDGKYTPSLRRRADRRLGGHRADHPAVDPDRPLRPHLRHLDRLPLPRRRDPGPADGRGADGDDRDHRAPPQLPGREAGAAARASAHHRRRPSRRC